MKQRLCVHCKHCVLSGGCDDYSDLTGDEPMEWRCLKNHFDLDREELDDRTVAETLCLAADCPDFELSQLGEELGVS